MIRGIGLDVVNVARLKRWLDRPGLLERFFHETELKLLESKGEQAILGLAARFAAKEAFGKALGTGLSGFTLRDICVTNDCAGKPSLTLCGDAGDEFQRRGGGIIFVSLTHEHDYALATVVIEEAPRAGKATTKARRKEQSARSGNKFTGKKTGKKQ